MSGNTACIALRLRGPMQSWEYSSQYNRRKTGLMPTKSGVAGLCCAAMGADRGSEREREILQKFAGMPMLAVSLAKCSRMEDYHTVLGTINAEGKIRPNAVLTHRQYVQDGDFMVFLNGDRDFLKMLAQALKNPAWFLWLGRKTCVPSVPVFAGLFDSEEDALKKNDIFLKNLSYERECTEMEHGDDSHMDQPISFLSSDRSFGIRRVRRCR